jgi:hypothetical protein
VITGGGPAIVNLGEIHGDVQQVVRTLNAAGHAEPVAILDRLASGIEALTELGQERSALRDSLAVLNAMRLPFGTGWLHLYLYGQPRLTGAGGLVAIMPEAETENLVVVRSQSRCSLLSVDEGIEDALHEEQREQFAAPTIPPGGIFGHR